MSLINDALKRATGKPVARPDLPAAIPIMRSAQEERRGKSGLIISLIFIAGLGTARFWYCQQPAPARVQAPLDAAKPAPHAASNPVQRAATVLENVSARNAEGTAVAESIVAAAPVPAPPIAAATPAPPPAAVAPLSFQELKLQAIYFRLKDPTALINGQTVAAGQTIGGAKVLAIQRTSVDVEIQGARKSLKMN
jgi:hypothetical protein